MLAVAGPGVEEAPFALGLLLLLALGLLLLLVPMTAADPIRLSPAPTMAAVAAP